MNSGNFHAPEPIATLALTPLLPGCLFFWAHLLHEEDPVGQTPHLITTLTTLEPRPVRPMRQTPTDGSQVKHGIMG